MAALHAKSLNYGVRPVAFENHRRSRSYVMSTPTPLGEAKSVLYDAKHCVDICRVQIAEWTARIERCKSWEMRAESEKRLAEFEPVLARWQDVLAIVDILEPRKIVNWTELLSQYGL